MRRMLWVLGVVVMAAIAWQLATVTYYTPYSAGSLEAQAANTTMLLRIGAVVAIAALVLAARIAYVKLRR